MKRYWQRIQTRSSHRSFSFSLLCFVVSVRRHTAKRERERLQALHIYGTVHSHKVDMVFMHCDTLHSLILSLSLALSPHLSFALCLHRYKHAYKTANMIRMKLARDVQSANQFSISSLQQQMCRATALPSNGPLNGSNFDCCFLYLIVVIVCVAIDSNRSYDFQLLVFFKLCQSIFRHTNYSE